jgi:uncharacterized repeat protein (TIGR04042 family)
MPEMHFVVRWPDEDEMRCYSPSLVVRDYLQVGQVYTLGDFMERSRAMLNIGSERVRAKYGYACSAAMDQLALLEERAAAFDTAASVTVVAFEPPAPASSSSSPVSHA